MSPDYRKMYARLCTAIDRSIDPLKRIPQAYPIADALERALLEAENVYLATAPGEEKE